MFKKSKKSKGDQTSLDGIPKTFDECWQWLHENNWTFYCQDPSYRLDEDDWPIYVCAEHSNDYSITVKAYGKTPLEAIQNLLKKIDENQLY